MSIPFLKKFKKNIEKNSFVLYNILVAKRGDNVIQKNNFCLLSIIRSDTVPSNIEAVIDSLPFGELEAQRLKNIKNPIALKNSLSALLCLRDLLFSIDIDLDSEDLTVLRKSGGKPCFSSLPLCFNITHSRDYCAVALSDTDIGIDLEFVDPSRDVSAISKRFFSSEEHSMLCACNNTERFELFYSLWTKKEALAKLYGKGLASISSDMIMDLPNIVFNDYRLHNQNLLAYLSVCRNDASTDVTVNNTSNLTLTEL
jgi:4'-phosphopantetheinyl transferase